MLATVTFAFLALLFIVVKLVLVVQMKEVCVIERLGKFRAVLQPGLHFLIPFIDRVAYRHETREQVLDIPAQSCISRDNIQISVDGLVYIQVMDGEKASYGIEDYRRASINLAQTTMRSEIGKLNLSQTFSERDTLNETIVSEIDKASDPWGIKVLRYEVRNITPSDNVIHTSEGDKQKQINEAHGRAQEIAILTQASAEGINLIAKAAALPSGDQAIKMRLLEQFISQTGNILKTADVSIVPSEVAKLEGFFQGMEKVTQNIQGAKS